MIVIVDYGMGNLKSVQNAFAKVGYEATITEDPYKINNASAIVLPGVGAFGNAINTLRGKKIDRELIKAIKLNKPFLGICLGMQLLLSYGEEGGFFKGLDLLTGNVKNFQESVKCPHMGWNKITFTHHFNDKPNPIFQGILDGLYFYFVHSYYCEIDNLKAISSTTDYGLSFASSIRRNNLFGVQFHPEKSSISGLKILKNFGELS